MYFCVGQPEFNVFYLNFLFFIFECFFFTIPLISGTCCIASAGMMISFKSYSFLFIKSLESLYLFLIVLLFFLILSLSSLLRSVVCFSLLLRSFQKDIRIYLPELAKIIVLPLFLWLPSLCQWDLNLTKLFPVTLIQYASFTLGHQFLHFFSIKSWSNWKCNDTFGICLLWGFQNFPYPLIFWMMLVDSWGLLMTYFKLPLHKNGQMYGQLELKSCFATEKFENFDLTSLNPKVKDNLAKKVHQNKGSFQNIATNIWKILSWFFIV